MEGALPAAGGAHQRGYRHSLQQAELILGQQRSSACCGPARPAELGHAAGGTPLQQSRARTRGWLGAADGAWPHSFLTRPEALAPARPAVLPRTPAVFASAQLDAAGGAGLRAVAPRRAALASASAGVQARGASPQSFFHAAAPLHTAGARPHGGGCRGTRFHRA